MNNLLARILLLVAGVLIGVGGFVGIKLILQDDAKTIPRDRTETVRGDEHRSTSVDSTDANQSDGNIAVPSRVDQLVFPTRTFDRKASIVYWVSTLSDDEILSWLEQSTEPSWQVSPANRTELQTTLLQKLSTTAPERAIDFALSREEPQQVYSMSRTVLQVWANTDIDGAVARVKELSAQENSSYYHVSTLLTARDDLPLDRMREIAAELGDESSAYMFYFGNLVRGDIENPRDTWYEILDIANRESVQNTTGGSLSKVATAWVEEKGLDVLDELVSSISNDSEYSSILPEIFSGISERQPEEIFDYIVDNLGDRATEIIQRSRLSYSWAQKDPKGMIAKVSTLPASRFRQSLIQNATWRWAENNPRQLLDQIELFPPGEREGARRSAIGALARKSPHEAAQYILQVADEELQIRLAQNFIQEWSYFDPKAAKEWVLGLPAAGEMRHALLRPLIDSLVDTDPKQAFELALQQPMEEDEYFGGGMMIGQEVSVLLSIAYEDIDIAIELLPQVRAAGKSYAFTMVGGLLLEAGNTKQALQLSNQLTEKQQKQYFQNIAMGWAYSDPEGLLKAFPDFPDAAKSRVAVSIVMIHETEGTFSDEEIADLEKRIKPEDMKLLDRLKEIDVSGPSPEDMKFLQQLYSW
ncbi:MAG: hypothetical protein F4W92_10315 [Gammaproteobacteria bacterium]|nr:hypothetical protein [Gammaproteobacteria bacterium]